MSRSVSGLARLWQLSDTLRTGLRPAATRRRLASAGDTRYLRAPGAWIRLREAGVAGPSVVFATDPPVPVELYDALIERLDEDYRVRIFEVPGFGGSLPDVGFRFSFGGALHAVERLLEQIDGAPHVLVFPCMVGLLGVSLARRRPDLVAGLIAPQMPDWPSAQAWKAGRDPKGILGRPVVGQIALAMLRRRRVPAWYGSALGDASDVPRFVAATLANFDAGGCFCLASAFQDFLTDHHGHLQASAAPALSIWGGADPSHRQTNPACALRLLTGAEQVVLPEHGHFPELEAPDCFRELLDRFVAEGLAR